MQEREGERERRSARSPSPLRAARFAPRLERCAPHAAGPARPRVGRVVGATITGWEVHRGSRTAELAKR